MDKKIEMPLEVAKEIQEKLKVVKEASELVDNYKVLLKKVDVLETMLGLLKNGSIDQYRCDTYYEDFLKNPEKLKTVKVAATGTSTVKQPAIGRVVDIPNTDEFEQALSGKNAAAYEPLSNDLSRNGKFTIGGGREQVALNNYLKEISRLNIN